MKRRRAWVSANALEVVMLSIGGSFVLVATMIATFAGLG